LLPIVKPTTKALHIATKLGLYKTAARYIVCEYHFGGNQLLARDYRLNGVWIHVGNQFPVIWNVNINLDPYTSPTGPAIWTGRLKCWQAFCLRQKSTTKFHCSAPLQWVTGFRYVSNRMAHGSGTGSWRLSVAWKRSNIVWGTISCALIGSSDLIDSKMWLYRLLWFNSRLLVRFRRHPGQARHSSPVKGKEVMFLGDGISDAIWCIDIKFLRMKRVGKRLVRGSQWRNLLCNTAIPHLCLIWNISLAPAQIWNHGSSWVWYLVCGGSEVIWMSKEIGKRLVRWSLGATRSVILPYLTRLLCNMGNGSARPAPCENRSRISRLRLVEEKGLCCMLLLLWVWPLW